MNARLRGIVATSFCVSAWVTLRVPTNAADAPAATQPTEQRAPGEVVNPFRIVQRLRQRVAALDLAPGQRSRLDQIFQTADQNARPLQDDIRDLPPFQKLARLESFALPLRRDVIAVLTPDQRAQFFQRILPATTQTHIAATQPSPPANPGAVGAAAPPFDLPSLGSGEIQLSALKGRVVVIEFGSESCPSFRDHAAAMQHLRDRYSLKAFFLLVYTREAHPSGGWETDRNREDDVIISQPVDLDERTNLAEQTRRALHIDMPVVVDKMDDSVAAAYKGFPNATIIIGRDGRIFARQQWTDPSGLPRLIEAAIAAKADGNLKK